MSVEQEIRLLKRSFHIYAYEESIFTVILFTVIILYLRSPIFLMIACVYIYKRYSYKETICLLLIILMILIRLLINTLEFNYYYINTSNDETFEATSIINKIKLNNIEGYQSGDVIVVRGNRYVNESRDLKASNRYYSYNNYEILRIFHLPNFRNLLFNMNKSNSNEYSSTTINNLLFNTYDNPDLDLSLSLLFLYI